MSFFQGNDFWNAGTQAAVPGQESLMEIAKIADVIGADIIYGADNYRELDITKAVAADLMSEVMLGTEAGSLIITGLINPQVVRTAEMLDIFAVLFIRGKRIPETILELAKDRNITVLRTEMTMFEVCGRLYSEGITPGQPE